MDKITLKKGTLLFRCSYELLLEPNKCFETDKTGIYFSTYILGALATCIKNDRSLHLGIYELKEDIDFYVGKHSYLDVKLNHYYYHILGFNTWIKKKEIETDEIESIENINHFDNHHCPAIDHIFYHLFDTGKIDFKDTDGEIFIGRPKDLKKILLKRVFFIDCPNLIKLIRINNYSIDYEKYLPYFTEVQIL